MLQGRSGRILATIASFGATLAGALVASPAPAAARAKCRVAELQFHPAPSLQIAVWIEDAAGSFVDTLYVTRATASLGLGNRPGREDFNSEVLWPYGRRENALPVWAHRRGVTYPRVVFQDDDDNDLSHLIMESSSEPYYCRPLRAGEDAWQTTIDTGTCATLAFTDKGRLSPTLTSYYPPRSDLAARQAGDHADTSRYEGMNGLDAVSRATPSGDREVSLRWALPVELPAGDYVAWIEVSRESDFNATYNPTTYPSPVGIAWAEYGHPYRGQPSVVWQLPFTVGDEAISAVTASYAGYGDPDGLDGALNPPDPSITTVAGRFDVPAGPGGNPPARTVDDLGAARLELEASPEGPYQLRVSFRPDNDSVAPATPGGLTVATRSATDATLQFAAPGDDGALGTAAAYEIRYGVGAVPTDEAAFVHGQLLPDMLAPAVSSSTQAFRLDGLQPNTGYWVGVRAQDDCLNASAVAYASFTTAKLEPLAVDACFVATAAWGTREEAHVKLLRGFRDRVLRRSILGELFVESYYTFGPALAEVIRPSETLRQLARDGLSPMLFVARSTDPGVTNR